MPDAMNLPAINQSLAATRFAGKLHHFPTIDSTSTHALRMAAEGAPAGSVYVADEQTAGRGRGAHAWHSEPGSGLYVSVLLRPSLTPADSLWLSLATGLAAHAAVREVTGAQPDIRWPNDLLVREGGLSKKFGGILAETQTEGDRLRHAVIGIGINVNHTAFPPEISPLATSLRLATGREQSREAVLCALLQALDAELQSLETTRPRGGGIVARIESASTWVRGKHVTVAAKDDESDAFSGTTAGLDPRGFLLVQTPTGIRTVLSGGVREA
jgi:BirA family biotin operon repressor/biotin-[acetyl-CoA-carboxylase] ligase